MPSLRPLFSDRLLGFADKKIASIKESASEPSPLQKRISRFIDEMKQSVKSNTSKSWAAYDIADQAFDAMQGTIARQKLAAYPPDITIEIARNACGTLEFDRAVEMIELGRTKARECLEQDRRAR